MRKLLKKNARRAIGGRLDLLKEADNESDSDAEDACESQQEGEFDLTGSQLKKKVIERVKEKIADHNY